MTYAKGYAAGRKKRRKEEALAKMRNERELALTCAILSTAMGQEWGVTKKGVHKKHNLSQLQDMAVTASRQVVDSMREH